MGRTIEQAARDAVNVPYCPQCAKKHGFRTHDGRLLSVSEFIAYGQNELKRIAAEREKRNPQ